MGKLTKQHKIIVGVIAFALVLTVGFALFAETLNINGTAKASGEFGVIFDRIEGSPFASNGAGWEDITIEDSDSNGTADVLRLTEVKLDFPTAYIEVPVIIKNTGDMPIALNGIRTENLNTTDINITWNVNDIKAGIVMAPNDEKLMKIRVEWIDKGNAQEETVINLDSFNIWLDYTQLAGTTTTAQ